MCVIEKQNNRILKHLKHLQETTDDDNKNCERVKLLIKKNKIGKQKIIL